MKKLVALIFIVSLAISTINPVVVRAEQTTSSKEDILSGNTLDSVFQDMKNSLKNGEEVSFAQSLEKVGGLVISSEPQYDLSNTTLDLDNLDASLTNLGFSKLSASLAGSFNTIDLSGSAIGCVNLFNESFGNLTETLELDNPTFPENFNVSQMLSDSKKAINKTYSDALEESEFDEIKENISLSSLFENATNLNNQSSKNETSTENKSSGMDMASTIAELEKVVGIDSSATGNAMAQYNSNKETIKKDKSSELEELQSNFSTMQDMLTAKQKIDNITETSKTERDNTETTLEETTKAVTKSYSTDSYAGYVGQEVGNLIYSWFFED